MVVDGGRDDELLCGVCACPHTNEYRSRVAAVDGSMCLALCATVLWIDASCPPVTSLSPATVTNCQPTISHSTSRQL